MRNRNIIGATTLVVLSFMLMLSCGKETKQTSNPDPNSSSSPKVARAAYKEGTTVTITCNSDCSDPDASGMMLNLVDGTASCVCSGGDSEIMMEGLDDSSNTDDMKAIGRGMELFTEDLGAWMTEEYGVPDVVYDSISITLYDYAKVMTVKYRVPNTTDVNSLTMVAHYDDNRALKKRITLKCSGTNCECYASFNAITGVIRCSCSDPSYCNPIQKETTSPPTKGYLVAY